VRLTRVCGLGVTGNQGVRGNLSWRRSGGPCGFLVSNFRVFATGPGLSIARER